MRQRNGETLVTLEPMRSAVNADGEAGWDRVSTYSPSAPHNVQMTTAGSPSGGSPVDKPPVPTPSPESRGTRIGIFAGTALVTTSVALFIVSGFAILSGESGVAQPVATVLGGAGVLGAGALTFRSAHNTRISAERTAADSLAHAETELEHARTVAADEKARHEKQLTEQRHQAEIARAEQSKTFERTHRREVVRDLRSRYTTCAEQLAHESAAIRLAGVYALASLADDWQQQNERDEKQVAIDLLRAYLRTPNIHTPVLIAAKLPDTGELEVRRTILLTLHKHSSAEASDPKSWNGFDCTITNADISNMSLSSLDLTAADLSSADLSNANLTAANLTSANLSNANLTAANLTYTALTDASMEDANLTGANLALANLTGTDLALANLTGANLTGANLTGAELAFSDLSEAIMVRADLTGADLTGARLFDADLSAAILFDADLSRANLSGANLSHVNLSGMDLTGVDLSGAFMIGAVLTAATLVGADLMDANLSGANLSGANLHEANLACANIDGTKLSNIYYTAATIWPEGAVLPASRDRP